MTILRLGLHNFRTYDDASVALTGHERLIALVGDNGVGKTNVLEALSLLAPGRGLRRAVLPDMIRRSGHATPDNHGEPRAGIAEQCAGSAPPSPSGGFSISAQLRPTSTASSDVDAPEPISVGTGVAPDVPTRRTFRINGARASAESLGEWLSVIWVTPAMDRLFTDGATARRMFLDRMVQALVPHHAHHLVRYDAAQRSRLRLLTDERPFDPNWIATLEAQMAEHAVAIRDARATLVTALNAASIERHDPMFPRADLTLDDRGDGHAAPSADTEWFRIRWVNTRASDATQRRTGVGPHRVDMVARHSAKDQPASQGSTGEQKGMLLSLVLAHGDLVAARRGHRPLLLLDEVAAHLDPTRRTALFERLTATGGQVWMTGTDLDLFTSAGSDHCVRFRVKPGQVVPL